MRILYCTLAIPLDRAHGGATHAAEVTNGLAALGHDVWVIGMGGRGGEAERRRGGLSSHDSAIPPFRHSAFRATLTPAPPLLAWQMAPRVRRIVREWQPDVIMERYYTFAGAGMLVAHQRRIPALLEVNAPVVDPPGTRKDTVDRFTGGLMRRWAERQCTWADRIVTPLATTVPETVRNRVVPLEWGANVRQFDPDCASTTETASVTRARLGIPANAPVIGFVGSFRAWHGVADAVAAFRHVRSAIPDAHLLLVGDGPERTTLEAAVAVSADAAHVLFTGAVPYVDVPAYYGMCEVAVAPFAPRTHPALTHFGFFWSPLKVFEAMAMRVPVVTTDIPRLAQIVDGAGVVVPEGDHAAMAAAIVRLLRDPDAGTQMGTEGRRRVIEHYSWEAHCRSLDAVLREMVAR
jgi:glycosyltransferase involved in cell wall biosynthesis